MNQYIETLRTQVTPLTQDFMTRFSQEAEQLKTRLEKDLTAVNVKVQPYVEEMVANIRRQVEELRRETAPFTETMDPEALKAVLLTKSQELKEQLDTSMNELQTKMTPFTEEMKGVCVCVCVCVCMRFTSHKEEEAGHILHEASVPAATEHANDPTKQNDGHRHAHKTCCHSPQICENTNGQRLI